MTIYSAKYTESMQALPVSFLEEIADYCRLTAKQREAFIAFYSQERSKEEVAKRLGISVNALYQRLIKVYDNISDHQDRDKVNELRKLLLSKYQTQDSSSIYQFAIHYRIEMVKANKLNKLRLVYYYDEDPRKQITKIPESVFQLTHLTELDLRNNKLQELPESISNLTNLTELDLTHNQLQELPESISNLTNLIKLYLGLNKLQKIPESIGNLTNLTELNLGGNQLKEPPKSIGNLTNLAELNLGGNQLQELPESIGNLINLTEIHLWNNQLKEPPKSIGNLTNLTRLDLSENELKELPESIGNLINLTEIHLWNNQLKELPESIANLTNLTRLDLGANELKELPKHIDNLTNLTWLDLDRNDLQKLPESIGNLTNLIRINLYANPLEIPPLEIAEEGITAIREYFRQLKEEGKAYIYEAKLLIVGEGGAGKTTLANKIQDDNYQLPDESNDISTEGIDVKKFKFKLEDEQEFCINIWDFGGQEIYHATHQFFLTKRSLYILVADSRKEDTDFYYWLNVVELLSDNSPILIVNNEKFDRKQDINEKALRRQFKNLKETLSSNLKNNRGLDTILSNIKHYIQNLPHIGQALPKTWVKVRQALEEDSRNYISLQEYFEICQKNGFTKQKDKLQLSGYLHDLGVCLHFQEEEDSLLYKTIILKPEWGTKAVYKVLDNPKVKENQGHFTREDLKNIWNDISYAEMRGELLELMKKFQLCYEIPSHKNTFIAPQLLSENQPDYDWQENNNLTLRYSYPDFMPKGIITRFIVVMHQYIEQQHLVWKTGVVLNKDGAKAEVIEYYGKRVIIIRISGKNKRDLMTLVTYEIDKLSDSFRQLKYSKLIPCNCQLCKTDNQPHYYDFKILKRFVNDRQQTIQCQKSYANVNVLNLIDDVIIWQKNSQDIDKDIIDEEIYRNRRLKVEHLNESNLRKEVFISYAWQEEGKAIADLIDEAFQDKGIDIIRDNKNIRYKGSIQKFMENLGRGKCIILIINQKYLESQYCMFELMEIADNGDFRDRIFPVILSGTNIFDPLDITNYIKYWQDKTKKLNQAMIQIKDQSNLQGIRDDLDLYKKIRDNFARLTDILRDMNNLTPDIHIDSEFQEIIEAVIEKIEE